MRYGDCDFLPWDTVKPCGGGHLACATLLIKKNPKESSEEICKYMASVLYSEIMAPGSVLCHAYVVADAAIGAVAEVAH
jgi:hypothetical protein